MNVLFVGDILQLPPVNRGPVFERSSNKSITNKLGCMTSVNIWQVCVDYDELTINEHQKKDETFSAMLDEIRRGCVSEKTIQSLKDRVITTPVIDKFEELCFLKSHLCVTLIVILVRECLSLRFVEERVVDELKETNSLKLGDEFLIHLIKNMMSAISYSIVSGKILRSTRRFL